MFCLETGQSRSCGCGNGYRYDETLSCIKKLQQTEHCTDTIECMSPLSCVNEQCDCEANKYLHDNECIDAHTWGNHCTDDVHCQDDMTCLSRVCDCTDLHFYNGTQCRPMTELQVQNPVVSSRTNDSLSFTWTTKTHDSVSYRVTGVPNGANSTATASGCSVTDLVSGKEYGLSVETYFPADANLAERKTSVALINEWTLPSKPGNFNWPLSQLSLNPMTFGFMPSDGNVAQYNIKITKDDVFNLTASLLNNQLGGLTLDHGTTYEYEIVAINGNRDESEKSQGIFKTNDAQRMELKALHVGLLVCLSLIHRVFNYQQ